MKVGHTLKKYFTFPANLLRIWLLGVGIGTALATYNIMSAVQFLYWFGPTELGQAFLEAGLLTWLIYYIYNRMHTYIALAYVAQVFAWGMTIWFGFVCILHLLSPKGLSAGWVYWAFLTNFPIISLYQTIFWSMSEKILTAQQLKSYRLIVNTGISISQIVMWGLIAFVISFPTFSKISYIITVAGAFLTAVYLNYFYTNLPHLQKLTINAQAIKVYNSLGQVLRSFYPNRLAWFVFLGALLAVQLDYLYWLVVNGKYAPEDNFQNLPTLAKFLASFWAASSLASFLIKIIFYGFLSKQYGVRTVLLVMPVLLFFFLGILSVLGLAVPDAFVADNAFIFILLVLCEQIREVLNEAFQLPSYRMYLLPVDDDLRADTQIKLDGYVAGFAHILFGIVMGISISYGYYAFWGQVVVALLGLALWVYSIFRLQTAYKQMLQNKLLELQKTGTDDNVLTNVTKEQPLQETISSVGFEPLSRTILSKLHSLAAKELPAYLNVLRIINPLDYKKAIVMLIDSPDAKLQKLRIELLKQIDRLVIELQTELQNTRLPEELDIISTLVYRHTRVLALERKKQKTAADDKVENIIRLIDEKVMEKIKNINISANPNQETKEIAHRIGEKIYKNITEAGELFEKNIQKENIDIKESHQILALQEAEKNCSLEILDLLHILINSKYFPMLSHADLVKKTYNFLRGAEYRLERLKYIEQLTLSTLPHERIFGAMLAGYAEESMKIRLLSQLLQDEVASVRYYAVLATSGAKTRDTFQILVEKLGEPAYINIAFATFVSAGDASLDTLEQVFHFAGQKEVIQRNIIYIYGYVGSNKAIEYLLLKLKQSNLNLRIIALKMLSKLGVKISADYRRNINEEIEEICRNLVWNMSAILTFKYHNVDPALLQAMEDEMTVNYNQIFEFLMLIYDASAVRAVQENLQSGDADKEDFAIELLEILIDETSKPLLIPLLSTNEYEEKLKDVQLIFPAERLPLQQTLHTLLQRGFRQINSWTRACALEELALLATKNYDFDEKDGIFDATGYDVFVANLMNPDMVLSELAANALKRTKGKNFADGYASFRQFSKYHYLNNVIEKVTTEETSKEQNAPSLRFEIAKFLQEIPAFKKVSGVILTRLSSMIEPLEVSAGMVVGKYEDWLDTDYFVVYSGTITLNVEGEKPLSYHEREFLSILPLFYSQTKSTFVKADTNAMLYKIPKMTFQELLLFEEDVVKSLLDI